MSARERATRRAATDYACRLAVAAPAARLLAALTTREGLRGWWTPRVSGRGDAGGELRFAFDGVDETIRMRVVRAEPSGVTWTCLEHSGLPDWRGTHLDFAIRAGDENSCTLDFCHRGLTPAFDCYEDCALGWSHFLASLLAYVERGRGAPFGSEP